MDGGEFDFKNSKFKNEANVSTTDHIRAGGSHADNASLIAAAIASELRGETAPRQVYTLECKNHYCSKKKSTLQFFQRWIAVNCLISKEY